MLNFSIANYRRVLDKAKLGAGIYIILPQPMEKHHSRNQLSLQAGSSVENGARSKYKGLVTSQERKSLQRSLWFLTELKNDCACAR